ncbi:TPA: GNAT family N-acetyltransferase [archaeon]|uniref:GNAT family N-acetyltransferase n=1 Tax=Candidatus Naiadarchaeum limnaeum TaxID=2756139 RepID=A0A832V0Q0_9ARCH|nr:GNAT family N-acetyltransferase [Candidatus Naiadarchaeum limnaeum]
MSLAKFWKRLTDLGIVEIIAIKPNTPDFENFYKIYVDAFPDPSERDSKEWIAEYTSDKYGKESINEGHLVKVIAIKSKKAGIVGFAITETIAATRNTAFGIIWYVVSAKDFFRHGLGSILVQKAIVEMEHIAKEIFHRNYGGTLIEVNDPTKMTREQIEEDTIDPRHRLVFWFNLHFFEADFGYAQPIKPGEEGEAVRYLMQMFRPEYKHWQKSMSIPADEYSVILRKFLEFGIEVNPDKEPESIRMLSEIKSKGEVKLLYSVHKAKGATSRIKAFSG